MDAIKALKLLIDVPEDKWCRFTYLDVPTKTCCAIGHLVRTKNLISYDELYNKLGEKPAVDSDIHEFLENTATVYERMHDKTICIMSVNDRAVEEYQQPTPKQRVIAFLIDMIKYENDNADEILESILNPENNETNSNVADNVSISDTAKQLLYEIQ